ncbi:MAG: prepilin peptidase [Clostridium sp.]|nr:prepilin peptidase [Clostridium sp.]
MESVALWIKMCCRVCVCGALVGLSIEDERTYEIPMIYTGIVFTAGLIHLVLDWRQWPSYLIGMCCVSLPLLLLRHFSGGRAVGGGDIKLLAAAGLLLGWKKVLLALELACLLGAVIHSLRVWFGGASRLLAFGPYLSVGIFISMCWGDALIHRYLCWAFQSTVI